jgi:UDP-N-acetyl-D-mannosaminuronic acid transferase (WecB/TagA/CpsF family)
MLIREECACGAKVEAEDDDRQDVQRAINTWRKLHVCGVRIGYYQAQKYGAEANGAYPDPVPVGPGVPTDEEDEHDKSAAAS